MFLKFKFIIVAAILSNVDCANAQLVWNTLCSSNNVPVEVLYAQSEFYFTNVGQTAVLVTNVETSCGCILVEHPLNAIAPGQPGKIVLRWDVSDETGTIKKTAKVITDNPLDSNYTLTSIVKIPDIAVFTPSNLTFNRTNLAEQIVAFLGILNEPIKIQSVIFNSEYEKPILTTIVNSDSGHKVDLHIMPSPAPEPYIIEFNVVIQQRNTGAEKNHCFKAFIK